MLHIYQEVRTLKENYGNLFRILHWSTQQTVTARLEEMELTYSQCHIMGFLALQDQPPCPRDVEAAFHLSHPTVSGLLSRMEQKGFLALRPDPNDRRCKRIHILSRGQDCLERIYEVILATEAQIVRNFTPEEQTQFTSFLLRAVDNMGGNFSPPEPKEEFPK